MIRFRRMRDDEGDYQLMSAWLSDPRVLEFYEGRDSPYSLDDIRRDYSPRMMLEEGTIACIIEHDGTPIGFIQYYLYEPGVFGIDQFIGVPELWNQGLGTEAVGRMLDYLFTNEGAQAVRLDPHVSNERAIRCYEKCGFRKVRILPKHELHEGEYRDSWLMEATPLM